MSTVATQLESHEVASIFPLMDGQAFNELRTDIETNGLREPIWLYEGKILDGRNRYQACQSLGIEPEFHEWEGDDPFAFVVSLNLHRRHLTESQRAMIADELATLRKGRPVLNPHMCGLSQEQAADLLGTGVRTVQHARKVRQQGAPGLAEAVKNGEVKLRSASEIADMPKAAQAAVIADGPEAINTKAKELREAKTAIKPITANLFEKEDQAAQETVEATEPTQEEWGNEGSHEPEPKQTARMPRKGETPFALAAAKSEEESESFPKPTPAEVWKKAFDNLVNVINDINDRGGITVLSRGWQLPEIERGERNCGMIVEAFAGYKNDLERRKACLVKT